MLNILLYEFYKSPNSGKQVASLLDGRRLLLVHSQIMGPATFKLKLAKDICPRTMADFDDVAELVGPEGVIPGCGEWGFGGSMTMANGVLYVAWTGEQGIYYSSAKLDALASGWQKAQIVLAGNYWLGDILFARGMPHLTYHFIHDRVAKWRGEAVVHNTESVGIAWLEGGEWRQREVYRGFPMFAPVADVDSDGRIHLAWGDVAERLWYAFLPNPSAGWEVEHLGDGKQPSIITNRGQVIIACEKQYPHIHYYVASDGQWQRDRPLTWGHDWFMPDLVHSPQLTQDHHGVVWIFFVDNTRKSTFWARWMGQAWSEIYNGPRIFFRAPHFDFNLLQVGRICVEKVGGESAEDIGMLLTCEPPVQRIEYRKVEAPSLNTQASKKVLFLDMLEVAETDNIELEVAEAEKHPQNPLMELGTQGAFDQDRVFNHGTVLYDGGKYRMWYGGIKTPEPGESGIPWWDTIHCGYAESDDGITWRRINVGLVEWNGSKDNNIVPYLKHAPVMIKDKKDPELSRRYKAFYFWNFGEMHEIARTGKYGKTYDWRDEKFIVDVLTSPDGIHLQREEGEVVFPKGQVKPFSAIPQSVFRDDNEPDPQKRYKAYGFMSLNLRRRGTCYMYSPDGYHWTPHPEMPVIDPAVRGNPPAVGGPTGQVHDTVCFPYEGYYIALYQAQHNPRNMPVELAVSRDGETFLHIKPGSKVIPLGEPGAWDSLTILPSMPIILPSEIRIYYGGATDYPASAGSKKGLDNIVTLPGLATLRRDGFTFIHLADGHTEGYFETIPFALDEVRRRLSFNLACDIGAEVRAELVDATTRTPLPGFSAEECHPLTVDTLEAVVSWISGVELPRTGKSIRLRVYLRGNAEWPRLFAFGFLEASTQ